MSAKCLIELGLLIKSSHLRVKDAGIWLNNANSLVESLICVCRPFFIGYDSCQVELQVLRLEIRGEAIANAVLFASGYLNVVAGRR